MRHWGASLTSTAVLCLAAVLPASAADLPPTTAPAPILSPELNGPASSFSAGPTLGTEGVGFQLGYRYNASFGGRAKLSVLSYDAKITADSLRLKSTVDFINGTLMADWYPFEGGFRVSAGLRVGQNRVKVRAEASDDIFTVGGTGYAADSNSITAITGKADYSPIAPVLTIGYEAQPSTALPLFLSVDAGVAYLGTSKVRLSAEGPDASDPNFQANLRSQEASSKRELNKYPVIPVLNVAAVYRF